MPRVRPLTKPDQRETEIREQIGSTMAVLRITQGELARRAGIAPQTMSDRMKDVGSMRLSELWRIQDVRRKAGF